MPTCPIGNNGSSSYRDLLVKNWRAYEAGVLYHSEKVASTSEQRHKWGYCDQLQGIPDEWRLRAGDWRVRCRDDHPTRTLEVLRILPRGQAYR